MRRGKKLGSMRIETSLKEGRVVGDAEIGAGSGILRVVAVAAVRQRTKDGCA